MADVAIDSSKNNRSVCSGSFQRQKDTTQLQMIYQKRQVTAGLDAANNGYDNDNSPLKIENPYIGPEKDLAAKYEEVLRRLNEMEKKLEEHKNNETTPKMKVNIDTLEKDSDK